MKKFILLFAIAVLIPNFLVAQKGHIFLCKEADCKITFPVEPEYKKEESEDGILYKATLEFEGQQYIFKAYTFRTNINLKNANQETLAKASMDGFTNGIKATSVYRKTWPFRGNIGLQAEIKSPEYQNTVYYKVIVIGQNRYEIAVLRAKGKLNNGGKNKFMNSFKLL